MWKKIAAFIVGAFSVTAAGADEFSRIKLRQFVSLGWGVVFNAPESWQDASTEQFFQVIDIANDAQFTSSGYGFEPGATLQDFAAARLSAVDKRMKFLKSVKAPYQLQGKFGEGIAAEYRGVYPDNDFESHYLVLCILTKNVAVSFTITAPVKSFSKNEDLYRWLLVNQLDVYKVIKQSPKDG
jgi:hypothetical protein